MAEPGFSGLLVRHLDPAAQEFFPMHQFFYATTAVGYVRPGFVTEASPLRVYLPPSSTTPSRALLLSMLPASVSESAVRRELEVFGDVRAVQMERRREGLVTVHFYDVRDAQAALAAVQEQHMQQQFRLGRYYSSGMGMPVLPPAPPPAARGLIEVRVVWAQFVTPVTGGLPDGNNQGTLVVFNLNPAVSASYLREIFQTFGPVKELRETPNKRNQRFVEFYDVRDAAKAMVELNGKEIHGNIVGIEFSRPGGQCKKFLHWTSPRNDFIRHPRPGPRPTPLVPPRDCLSWKGNPSKSPVSGTSSSSSASSLPVLSSKKGGFQKSCSALTTSDHNGGGRISKLQLSGRCRPWRGGGGRHGGKMDPDPRFLIDEDVGMDPGCKDSRTTVMIKNIPNKYSQKLVLNMLDNHCIYCNEQVAGGGGDQPLSSYDFVYLPIDFLNKCNVGYGFVNMTSPEGALRLYKAFHHQSWEVFNSRKICQVTYARLQGLEALREHFKNSKFPGDAEEYMPVVFSPPRDGHVLTDPVPIVGRLPPLVPPPLSAGCNDVSLLSETHEDGHVDITVSCDEGGGGGRNVGCSYDENDDSGRAI